jgi:tetratricopeptide (TPR) repeat protein
MGILGKIFTGSGGAAKAGTQLKQVRRLITLGRLAEAAPQLEEIADNLPEDAKADLRNELALAHEDLFRAQLEAGEIGPALVSAERSARGDMGRLADLLERIAAKGRPERRLLEMVQAHWPKEERIKRLMLTLSKEILKEQAEDIPPQEMEFLEQTAEAFPMWKEGVGLLADRYLTEGRHDAEALQVYRNAYPNRKADRRLREVLLSSLVTAGAKDEFAATVYKDAVETSDNPDALRLLAEYMLDTDDFTPSSVPYIERALSKGTLSAPALEKAARLALSSKYNFINRLGILLAVYRQGNRERDVVAFLSEQLAEQSKLDDEAIKIMSLAFEQRLVTKRSVLILCEHCLAHDRSDPLAIKVYETYLSSWPDRPQRRIYSLLAHTYAHQTRVDDQATKIYEEALLDSPTDPVVVQMLARAYHATDRRDAVAEQIYRQAFPIVDEEVKLQLAQILAEIKVEAADWGAETLQYLTVMGRPTRGPLAGRYDEALTNCFLVTGRRGEQAQQAYFRMFESTEDSGEINLRLVELLAEIIAERGTAPPTDSIEMRVYRKLFELQKFSTPPEIAFVLLDEALKQKQGGAWLTNLAVRCFEADPPRFIKLIEPYGAAELIQEAGDFYIEHYNFPLAAQAYESAYRISPTEELSYKLAKIYMLDGKPALTLEHLERLKSPSFAQRRMYFEAAAWQMIGQPDEAAKLLDALVPPPQGEIPEFLLKLRRAINLELVGQLPEALAGYSALAGKSPWPKFERWLKLQVGIVNIKLKHLDAARELLEEALRQNPNGRAEQLFCSLALFATAYSLLRDNKLVEALPLFARTVEVNRTHRLLRDVIVNLLNLYGERAFFGNDLARAAQILEVCHRILPKRVETKRLLAYTYHLVKDYGRALIYYRDINWTDDDPRLERSQAYCYLSNGQPEKAWKVFLDLAKRGNLTADDFPRLVGCFIADKEAQGGRAWERIEFPANTNATLLTALLVHDGLYERAAEQLNALIKADPQNLKLRWYMGRAYSQLHKRDIAVHNWKELQQLCLTAPGTPEQKTRQLTELGLAFLDAGYALEAMSTWDELRKLDERNPDLPLLYAATLDLNGYTLARKDQHKLAREEWRKALKFDPDSITLIQNFAIASLELDDYDESTRAFQRLGKHYQDLVNKNPRVNGHLSRGISFLERAMNTFALTRGKSEVDVTKARAEDAVDFYQRCNQFYWILSLDKRATTQQVEKEYFRLIKIFNPERHADDFMLVEEAYTNLIKEGEKRAMIDLFVYNPLDIPTVRQRLKRLPPGGLISFEQLDLPQAIPGPDYQQLKPTKIDETEVVKPLDDLLALNFKIPDWTIL